MPNHRRCRPLTHTPLPLQTVRMGRWTPNVSQPHHGYYDPISNTTPLVHETPKRQFNQIYDEDDGSGTWLKGTVLAYGSSKKLKNSQDIISTEQSKIYQLDNPEAWFTDAIRRQENRRWIEEALRAYGEISMIIGYQTVTNGYFEVDAQNSTESSAAFQAPVTASITAATSIPLLSQSLDIGGGRGSNSRQQSQQSFTSPGELVVAVQYRRMRFRHFSSKVVDSKVLEAETRWKYVWDMRGQASEDNDIIEASLVYDDVEEEDGEFDEFHELVDTSSDSDD